MPINPTFIGDQELPYPEGVHGGPAFYAADAGLDYQDGRWTLTGLARDFHLFSAVALTTVGLPLDPVAMYWAEAGLPDREAPYWLEMPRPVFGGLWEPFDRAVFACPNEHARGLIRFLDRLSVRRGGVVIDSVRQTVPVVDWRLLDKVSVAPPTPPTVPVDVYGLETTGEVYAWEVPADPWTGTVDITRRPRPRRTVKRKL